MSTGALLIVILVVLVLTGGAWPAWPHSRRYGWGYTPSVVGVLLTVLLVVLLVRALD